jgi:putative beta-lysine N-acetyltransferase
MNITLEKYSELAPLGKAIDLDPHNRRIKVYQLPKENDFTMAQLALKELAKEHQCDKIIFYSKPEETKWVEETKCDHEGKIDGFFQGEDAYIYSIFLNPDRNQPIDWAQEEKVMQIVNEDNKVAQEVSLPAEYAMRSAVEEDAIEMAKLYGEVFETYPTPLDDPEFIKEMMNDHVSFTIVEHNGQLISACSADQFPQFNAAEMTDCATLPEHRGQGLLSQQFIHLEKKMEQKGVQTLFSYSRAVSVGMNLINARHGFTFGGRMIQNSNISGRFEDMNIWVKGINADSN